MAEEQVKKHHGAYVVRLPEPKVHTNADTLEIYDLTSVFAAHQVVAKKGQFKAGDLAIYIQPDTVVPQTEPFRFIWEPYLFADGTTPTRKRRITVRKFRGEWSEGLMLPITAFSVNDLHGVGSFISFREGDDVSDVVGTRHWEDEGEVDANTGGDNASRPRFSRPRTLKGWFFYTLYKLGLRGRVKRNLYHELEIPVPKYDVHKFNHYRVLEEGETVIVTEKIHGSQGRYFFKDGEMFAGSKNFWKAKDSPCVWRRALRDNPWIEEWCRANEGSVLYGEVTPTQKNFHYGSIKNSKNELNVNFWVFNILGSDGKYLPKAQALTMPGTNPVPILGVVPWGPEAKALASGKSKVIGANNILEGIVVSSFTDREDPRVGRVEFKVISNEYLEKAGKL